MEAKAIAKGVRIAPRKARLVIDLIRGKDVAEAEKILANLNKEASRLISKVLKSAIANAENNHNMNADKLYIAEVFANQGTTMKRIRAATQGRANRIRKRTSHITVVLKERE